MRAINNLVCILARQGPLDEAEALYREALAGLQASQGAAHAHTRTTAACFEVVLVLRAKAAAARATGIRRAVVERRPSHVHCDAY